MHKLPYCYVFILCTNMGVEHEQNETDHSALGKG